jgi:hypothetical protein
MTHDIKIYFENLAVLKGGSRKRLPLEKLDEESHIHGGLRIVIGGRRVPRMGFWNDDDVCLGYWLIELANLFRLFEEKEVSDYLYDEGEQGQPAFLFERREATVFFSITDSAFSGGSADPDWQKIPCLYSEFREQYENIRAEFIARIRAEAPQKSQSWLHLTGLIKRQE